MQSINEACSVYCQGPILSAVQLSDIFNDSKTFVDMPMKYDPDIVWQSFSLINSSNIDEVAMFIDTNFDAVGSDLKDYFPTDFVSDPSFLSTITNSSLRQWASDLNQLWPTFGRQVSSNVTTNPSRHSFLPRSYPMIVPGGRFRESYYWDSYWICEGLIVCDMISSAKNVISNLLEDVTNFGFVPNGGRIYYLDRSQPPMLSEMMVLMVEESDSVDVFDWVLDSIPLLETEYSFWMNESKGHSVNLIDDDNIVHVLNCYHSNTSLARPESYSEDIETAHKVSTTAKEVNETYMNLRTGAESGWDFTSRFFGNGINLTSIDALNVVPVELNTIMYRFELNLARLNEMKFNGDESLPDESCSTCVSPNAIKYMNLADNRSIAIEKFLWNDDLKYWMDYNVSSKSWTQFHLDGHSSISSWIPLLGLVTGWSVEEIDNVVESLKQSSLLHSGGILTTNVNSTQQWDSPNAWSPLIWFITKGLESAGTDKANELKESIVTNWIDSNYMAYRRTGFMYEKYNAFIPGFGGGGGEYTPQTGFGWTNGVALKFLHDYYSACSDNDGGTGIDLSDGEVAGIVIGSAFFGLVIAAIIYRHRRSSVSKREDSLGLVKLLD